MNVVPRGKVVEEEEENGLVTNNVWLLVDQPQWAEPCLLNHSSVPKSFKSVY